MPELTDFLQIDFNESKVVLLNERVYKGLNFVVVKVVDVLDLAVAIVHVAIKLFYITLTSLKVVFYRNV